MNPPLSLGPPSRPLIGCLSGALFSHWRAGSGRARFAEVAAAGGCGARGAGAARPGLRGGTGRREGRELRGPHGCALSGDPPAAGPDRAPKLRGLGCRLGRGGEGSAVPGQLPGGIPGLRKGKGRMCLAVFPSAPCWACSFAEAAAPAAAPARSALRRTRTRVPDPLVAGLGYSPSFRRAHEVRCPRLGTVLVERVCVCLSWRDVERL